MPGSSELLSLGQFVTVPELTPKVGDLIEIDRTLYIHWAVYVGDGRVVHVVGPNAEDIPTDWAFVQKSSLEQVAGCSRVRVNNKSVRARERGVKPLEKEKVVQYALENLDQKVEYNVLTRNAEFYVTQWKYGHGWSDQASIALSVMKSLNGDIKMGHNTFLTGLQAVFDSPIINYKSPRGPQRRSSSLQSTT
ncbi:HRAS-like suppressor 3 [Galendromus occidentalis]|uniref:HRAS-like suppressor 3 n=1 Tax=Galendromus occidentalis TaxID=34638 RepID=A0AAJ6VXR5_9ACAR|nr:HRAS-like suppressor 3 [Galendromus occidentalis]